MFDYQASIYQHTPQNHICLFERVMVGEQRGYTTYLVEIKY